MKNVFNSVKMFRQKRNIFDLSHAHKTSFNPGQLIPVMCLECVPGDLVDTSTEALVRFQPMVSPMMHRADVYTHTFFVPTRLLWDNWERYITNTKDPVSGLLPVAPYFEVGDALYGVYTPLMNYFGIPTPPVGSDAVERVSAFPFAAYNLIWNEYYRDQNLQDPIYNNLVDGFNNNLWEANGSLDIRRRAWMKDYFTSALPFAQKGDPVQLPVEGFNDVPVRIYSPDHDGDDVTLGQWSTAPTSDVTARGGIQTPDGGADGVNMPYAATSEISGTSTTINDLRTAFSLQKWLEKAARGGSRLVENIYAHFGVKPQDYRLQRPEYVNGSSTPVSVSEVLNTTGTTELPQGNMSGHGIAGVQGKRGKYAVKEWGYMITLASVLPRPAYQQGIPKMFTKYSSPYEFYWPDFAHLGEQEVKNREIYAFQGLASYDTFGYQARYAEYRYEADRVSGDMQTTLDTWHWGRIFEAAPALNEEFIECVPSNRIFAVTDGNVDHLICTFLNKVKMVRAMPKYGTPGW